MRTLRASNHGVTLIELLIAMFISTIAAVALFALFIGQSRAMRQSTESMEINESVRVGLDTISRDLRSVGFLVNPGISVRIENDCGAGGGTTPPGVSWAGTFSLGGATAVDANGDVAGTAAEDGCPNGSDRLGVFYRARMDFLTEAGAPNGANPQVDWACGGPLGTDCSIPFLVAGITGTGCTGSGLGGTSDPIALCANDDPFRCLMVEIQPQGNQCDCTVAGLRCTVNFNMASTGNK